MPKSRPFYESSVLRRVFPGGCVVNPTFSELAIQSTEFLDRTRLDNSLRSQWDWVLSAVARFIVLAIHLKSSALSATPSGRYTSSGGVSMLPCAIPASVICQCLATLNWLSRTQMLWPFLAPPESSGELGRRGPYRVLKMLGQGGMGVVFKAEDVNLHRLVVLKVMRPEISAAAGKLAIPARSPRAPRPSITTTLLRFIRLARIEACRFWQWNFSPRKSLEDWLRPDRLAKHHGGRWRC